MRNVKCKSGARGALKAGGKKRILNPVQFVSANRVSRVEEDNFKAESAGYTLFFSLRDAVPAITDAGVETAIHKHRWK